MKKPTKTELRENSIKQFISNYATMDYHTYCEWASEPLDEATFKRLYKKLFAEVWQKNNLTEKQIKEKFKLLSSCPKGWNVSTIRANYTAEIVGRLYNRFGMTEQPLISYNGNNRVSYIKAFATVTNNQNGEVEAKLFRVADQSGTTMHYVYATTEGVHIRKSFAFLKEAYASTAKLKRQFSISYAD